MKLVSELWKDIKGFEGSYQVSTKGNDIVSYYINFVKSFSKFIMGIFHFAHEYNLSYHIITIKIFIFVFKFNRNYYGFVF